VIYLIIDYLKVVTVDGSLYQYKNVRRFEEGIRSNSAYQQVEIRCVTCVALSRGRFEFVVKNRMFLLFYFKLLYGNLS